jgi:glycerol uptake facilitator-like aquaporin
MGWLFTASTSIFRAAFSSLVITSILVAIIFALCSKDSCPFYLQKHLTVLLSKL